MPYTYRVADTNFDYEKTYMLHYIQIYQTYFMKPGFYYPGFHDHNLSYVLRAGNFCVESRLLNINIHYGHY